MWPAVEKEKTLSPPTPSAGHLKGEKEEGIGEITKPSKSIEKKAKKKLDLNPNTSESNLLPKKEEAGKGKQTSEVHDNLKGASGIPSFVGKENDGEVKSPFNGSLNSEAVYPRSHAAQTNPGSAKPRGKLSLARNKTKKRNIPHGELDTAIARQVLSDIPLADDEAGSEGEGKRRKTNLGTRRGVKRSLRKGRGIIQRFGVEIQESSDSEFELALALSKQEQ